MADYGYETEICVKCGCQFEVSPFPFEHLEGELVCPSCERDWRDAECGDDV